MKGQRRKNKFIKRRTWGSIRSRLRSRFAVNNHELEPEFLKPERTLWGWDSSRLRWQLEHHHDRFAKNLPTVLSYLSGMEKGTEKLERQYGVFFPRCIKCNSKCNYLKTDMNDKELYGLCNRCAQPILNRRYKLEQDAREARSLLLARRMLPAQAMEQINELGYTTIVFDDWTYLLGYTGKIYNFTTSMDYCVHPRDWQISNWDRVISLYLLLRQRPLMVEEISHKRPMPLGNWLRANTLTKEVIKDGKN